MNVTSLSRRVPVSSQPFLALDRNLIAIMKHYSCSTVKNHRFCFRAKLTIASHLNPFYTGLTTISHSDYLLHVITRVLSDSHHCGGLSLLRAIYRLMGKQPSLQSFCNQEFRTCQDWWWEDLHHLPTQPSRGTSKPKDAAQLCQRQVLRLWSRRAQRPKCLHWAPM